MYSHGAESDETSMVSSIEEAKLLAAPHDLTSYDDTLMTLYTLWSTSRNSFLAWGIPRYSWPSPPNKWLV